MKVFGNNGGLQVMPWGKFQLPHFMVSAGFKSTSDLVQIQLGGN